jgi:hypothetical protein
MKTKHYIRCDPEGYTIYIGKKKIKIKAIDLKDEVEIDY